ncbi:MAG: Zn-finger nucleic acid-binding protein [Thermoproteota archaeon]|jgi:Zn-finger nucleic acid-binding protein
MQCPSCQVNLKNIEYESCSIDICETCNGTWLDKDELTEIVQLKDESFKPEFIAETLKDAKAGVPISERDKLVHCPKCTKNMTPVNYSYSSGIIIDYCPDNHGVWLDGNELERIQAHQEYWYKKADKNSKDWVAMISDLILKEH